MASTRTVALSATGLLAILAAAVIGSNIGTEQADRNAASASSSSAIASTSASAPSSSRGTTRPSTPHTSQTPTSPSAPVATTPGSSGAPSGAGLEVLPTPAGDPTSTGYSLPPITTTEPSPLVSDTPKPGVAKGRLVAGFPAALAPPKGTEVESSSLTVDGDTVQVGLVATGGDPQAIVAHYRQVMTAHGYVEKKVQGVENAPAAAFKKGNNTVTVTTGDGKTYVIAHLHPKGSAG